MPKIVKTLNDFKPRYKKGGLVIIEELRKDKETGCEWENFFKTILGFWPSSF